MQQIEAAAAQTGTRGFDHGKCRGHRHRGIEGIAARRENLLPRLACQRIGAGDGRLVRNPGARRKRSRFGGSFDRRGGVGERSRHTADRGERQ